ncbi:hypothetical protein [Butyrivibrio sp. AE3004]|uniref:hypothetical protein n=1 Tax=Butyrivibrio sp. AE3004 TaxID=1506994 RepID=UPI00049499EA|nr:hypothetical protein [Butyrivibrio sp. AE3004]
MKRGLKQLLALLLALVVAINFTPFKAQAAGPKVTLSRSGKVKTVMYKGGKAKTSSFTMIVEKGAPTVFDPDTNAPVYDEYYVRIKIKRFKMSKKDIIKTVKESRRRKGGISTYVPIVIDSKGNYITNCIFEGALLHSESDYGRTLKAKQGRTTYYIYNWRNYSTYAYRLTLNHGTTGIYIGFAGLRNGQLTKNASRKKMKDYYSAGYGKNKKGFIIAGSVTD